MDNSGESAESGGMMGQQGKEILSISEAVTSVQWNILDIFKDEKDQPPRRNYLRHERRDGNYFENSS